MPPRYVGPLACLLLVPLVVLAQDGKRMILSSHDRIDGPLGGESQVSDLQVFEDGEAVYIEEGTKTIGDKPERLSYEIRLHDSLDKTCPRCSWQLSLGFLGSVSLLRHLGARRVLHLWSCLV